MTLKKILDMTHSNKIDGLQWLVEMIYTHRLRYYKVVCTGCGAIHHIIRTNLIGYTCEICGSHVLRWRSEPLLHVDKKHPVKQKDRQPKG